MKPLEKIILGTVQLGIDYGISNTTGKPTRTEALEILKIAANAGIKYLDTASAYGDSEELIGVHVKQSPNDFKVITKFHVRENENTFDQVASAIGKLGVVRLNAMMFHSYKDVQKSKECVSNLIELRKKGVIEKIGVSVYSNDEIESLIGLKDIDLIQAPFNLLDNHKQKGELLKQAKKTGKTIHVRSVFLQGLFFKSPSSLPENLSPLKETLKELKQIQYKSNLSMNELALGYVLSKEYVDGVLIGVETPNQLKENLRAVGRSLTPDIIGAIDAIEVKEKAYLNPSNWR